MEYICETMGKNVTLFAKMVMVSVKFWTGSDVDPYRLLRPTTRLKVSVSPAYDPASTSTVITAV